MIMNRYETDEQSRQGRVLIVDNEEMVRCAFRRVLEISLPGMQIDEAENGAEAVRSFVEHGYDVVLMDIHMPVMDGEVAFEAITEVCREKHKRMPSVLFCTGHLASTHVKAVVENDPSHRLFIKPISTDVIVEAVRNRIPQNTADS